MDVLEDRIFATGVNMLSSQDRKRIIAFFSGTLRKSSMPKKERIYLHQTTSPDGVVLTFSLELNYLTYHWRKLRSISTVIPPREDCAATIVCGR